MLRVGLTGGLGAGKSTAARLFADRGATILSSDAIGRDLMQPGQRVYTAILERFGPEVVRADGSLDRSALARLAFDGGQLEALNGIVHPAVIERQEALVALLPQAAIAMVESALIFETRHGRADGWRGRFDRMVLITAPERLKIARFLERSGATAATRGALEAEARRRLAAQMPDSAKAPWCDFVIANDGSMAHLETQVDAVWRALATA